MISYTLRVFALYLTLGGTPALPQSSQSQAPMSTPQPSAGHAPEQTPFGTPYGSAIGHDPATAVLGAVETEAHRIGWPISIAAVDAHGERVAFSRADEAPLASGRSAQRRASTASRWRRETRVFFNAFVSGPNDVKSTRDM
jgi:glc operon protein GlcG